MFVAVGQRRPHDQHRLLEPRLAQLDPLFDPVERNQAVVDTTWFGERFPVKFGIDYTSLPAY